MDKIYIACLFLGTIYIVLCLPNWWRDRLSDIQQSMFIPFMLAYFFGLGGMIGFYQSKESFLRFGIAAGAAALGWLIVRGKGVKK